MKLVILESPYAGDIEANVSYARLCVRQCLQVGEAAIASHLLYTQPGILRDDVSEERRTGIRAGLAWSSVCDYHVFYTDRGWSKGMLAALQHCIFHNTDFRLRSLNGAPTFPSSMSEEVEELLRSKTEGGF